MLFGGVFAVDFATARAGRFIVRKYSIYRPFEHDDLRTSLIMLDRVRQPVEGHLPKP